MLVDQTDTPLFLGAIHRTLPRVTVTDVGEAAIKAGARCIRRAAEEALADLAPDTLVLTDAADWSVISPPAASGSSSSNGSSACSFPRC